MLNELLKPGTALAKREKAEALLRYKEKIHGFDTSTPLVTFEEAQQLLELLPAKYTEAFRALQRETFQRVQAGDQGLHEEVNRNALSSNPVAQLARDGLGISEAVLVGAALDAPLKRKRAELEYVQEEVCIGKAFLEARKELVKTGKELLGVDKEQLFDVDKARLELEKARFAFEQEKAAFEREKAAAGF